MGVGTYELQCQDSYGDGWHGGYIEIGDETYCSSFSAGSLAIENIVWAGSEPPTPPGDCSTGDDAPVRIRASVVFGALGQENMQRAVEDQEPDECYESV